MDDFEEVRHLGRGAYGEVLLMRQTSTGLLCAVKKLGKAAMTAGEEAEHLAEVKALQALQHPCILRYYGSTELDESVSLVMEFADAGDLQHLLKAQADSGNLFEAAQLFALFSQLFIAVAHVHSNRVLHRDLKPSNVMLTSDGLLKLGDFGVAKVLAGTTVMDNMTCVGSPTYMAPEIVSGDPYGAACDVWSLGVILYEMASFQRPFEGRSLGELVMRISSGQFKDLREQIQEKRAIKKELKRRRSERQQMLLNALGGPLKTLEEEKLLTLATAARTILYRRGEVLCQEGEMRAAASQSRLLVLMLGEARCLRIDEKAPKRALGLSQSRRMAAMQSAGTLLPGHAVNAASIMAEEPEPFTVVIDTVEALVLTLPFSDLARMMSVQMMEQLKVTASERSAWRRSQGAAMQAEATTITNTALSRAKEPPKEELARLETVLHDRPEILCQSPRQPPGISHEEGRDMMTSSLSVRRAPTSIECPKIHPALIHSHLKAKDVRFKARQTMPMLAQETETSRTTDSDVMRSCDDWGFRRVQKRQSLRRARTLRGASGDMVETEAIAGLDNTLEDIATSCSSFQGFSDPRPVVAKRATVGVQPRAQGVTEGGFAAGSARKCPPVPTSPMKGMEGNLRVASIEQFLEKGSHSWRGWGKFGRPRTLAKLDDEHLSQVLPTV